MHCRNFQSTPINRRELLKASGFGFGAFALDAMSGLAQGEEQKRGPHHEAKAKNVIFLYMDGGVSHVDSFDPKPALKEHNGKNPADFFKVAPTQFNNNGKILASPWEFKPYGQSGIVVVISFRISLNM